jgi:hypothetical protein
MFSDRKHDKVAYFGVWAEEAGDRAFRKEALRICGQAVERCVDVDLRGCPEVQEALSYLERHADRAGPINRFRRALEMPDPLLRSREVEAAVKAIARATVIGGGGDG